jgi:hypothetical protein
MDDGKYPLLDAAAKIFEAALMPTAYRFERVADMPTVHSLDLMELEGCYALMRLLDEWENDHKSHELELFNTRLLLCRFIENGIRWGLPNSLLSESQKVMPVSAFRDFLASQNANATLIEIVDDMFHQLTAGYTKSFKAADVQQYEQRVLMPRFDELKQTPNYLAWSKARQLIEAAADDPTVKANPETVEFLSTMLRLIAVAFGASKAPRLLEPLNREARAKQASDAAQQKNAKARDWIKKQWQNRTDQGQSKRAFADQYRHLVKQKFGVVVGTEQIVRKWLPRTKT